ncbi:MAG: trypsin-like peptidase domain-containing protein [Flavobacteriales bacterium]
MKKSYLFLLLLFSSIPFLLKAQKGPIKVADEKAVDISTQHPYNQEGDKGVVFKRTFSSENSSYIKFYFENFQLEGDDHLEIRSPETGQRFIYAGGGKVVDKSGNTISDFWSLSVRDDEAVIRLYSDGPASSYGFDISKVAYGYPQDSIESLVYEAVCGSDDKEDLECYNGTTMYDKARAVCRLLINGSSLCTGWLLGDQGHVITNNHCIGTNSDAQNTEFQFNYRNQTCGGNTTTSMDVVSNSSTLICTDADLDYTLVELPTNPTGTYGFLSFRSSGPVDGERIYIPQHPQGNPKKISVNDDQSSTGYGKIQNTNGTNSAGLPTRVEYFTDTDGGSSGSPVIAYSDHTVVALHNTGGCENGGNRVDSIISDMGSCLPPNAIDSVVIADFDANKVKSCDGWVDLTNNSSNADSLVWNFGDGDTSHATNPSHAYTSSNTYTIQLVAYGSSGGSDTATSDILVSLVDTPSTNGDTICAGGSASLSASGSAGDILWYGDTTSSPVDTGTSFTTGPVYSDSTLYVRQNEGGISTQNVGPVDNTFFSGSYFTANDNWGCVFDVQKPMVLESAKVYSGEAATRTIELLHNGSVIASKNIFIGNGQERIDLNFEIPAGTGYLLKVTGSTVNLYRNDGGASYPYEISGLVSITGNNTTSGTADDYYYYFYDWEVHELRCKSDWKSVPISVSDSNLIDSVDVTDVQSCDGSDGALSIFASSGSTPYQYSIDNGSNYQSNNLFSGLAPSTYNIIVQDVEGCVDSSTATVDPKPSPVINSIDTISVTSCGAGDGSIQIQASSGTPPLSYSIDGGASYQGSNSFSGLSTGDYQIVVQGDSGCTASDSIRLIAVDQPIIDSLDITPVSCNGDSDGGIVINSSNASSFSIDDGMNYQASNSFNGLTAGTYSVEIKNSGGCKDSTQATVSEPLSLSLNGGSNPTTNGCDGTAWVDVSGGTQGYDYQWDVGGSANNDTLDSLCAGTYQVVVTDSNGCQDSIEVTVDETTGIGKGTPGGNWQIQPVPASKKVTLVRPVTALGAELTLRIYNMLGEEVFRKPLPTGQKRHVIDLSQRAEGIYIIDLKGAKSRRQFKLPITRP